MAHPILEKYLTKLGLKSANELTDIEKVDFDRWNRTLSEKEVTVDSIKEFCLTQKDEIEKLLENLDNSPQKNERLILLHSVYRRIANQIDGNRQERESLEKYLQSQLDNTSMSGV